MSRDSSWVRAAIVILAVIHLTCSTRNPAAPPRPGGDADRALSSADSASGGAVAQNLPPNLVLRTHPPADPSTSPFPTISGDAPLVVRFNLCRSDDPDAGDSLNYQFYFGDSDRPPFNPDGSFAPDFDHFCRTEHVYERPGTYVAAVSVTDKHLDDQSHEVLSFARRTQSLTVVVASPGPPASEPAGTPPPGPGPTPTPPPPPRLVITIVAIGGNLSYSPNPATARVGQRIVWVNAHDVTHTATADGGAFDTGLLAPGASSSAITPPAGTFPYHCAIHPGMVATVIVK